ncbi:MAG TPA: histidinol dehydrogenase [Tepidisphaeraceae bacterium]|jgi:histidinol dehydrogenase|nr:histidinol dehydrogenase [Tepidisphaeraceae bacterium]
MIPILNYTSDRDRIEYLLRALKLSPAEVALSKGDRASALAAVMTILSDVASRGDDALVDSSRKFDDPNFTKDQIRVTPEEMKSAVTRVPADLMSALKRAISQVREYQTHILPKAPPTLHRPGVDLGLRFTPLDSAGLYFPGGKASYPSSLIHLTVPAQVAGVQKIAVCTPPSKYGRSDLILAACHELKLENVFRAGGAAAIAALAFGTATIPAVDKIVGPGNTYVQLAKRALAGAVGIDGYLGPSEIVVLADDSAHPSYIAADLIAQAEHDPGSCYLLTPSTKLAAAVAVELTRQSATLDRQSAITKALAEKSAIIVTASMEEAITLSNRFAAEHVNLQTTDNDSVLQKLTHAGAIFLGPHSPVAAGDYVAGPSHCLPTNTTARFSSGISVYEFLKRSSIIHYDPQGLSNDAAAIISLANAEHLTGHAQSITARAAD